MLKIFTNLKIYKFIVFIFFNIKLVFLELAEKIRSWNEADATLYSHALTKYKADLHSFGISEMETQLLILRQKRVEARRFCEGEKTQSEECMFLEFSEHNFTNFIWNKNPQS